ncbi:Leucine-rich repeat domain containing protein [Parasponia andersonii]|uniref:Leucine-rich repeat domain containing protein n=1 Tax=Parasponia andersonii TaxID=3476 RepID=A0A2P5B156_PARAD|nr:Leucine-rich repeat domain containing protein [Parasponia andersonii]
MIILPILISADVYAASGQCLSDQQTLLLRLKNSLVFDTAVSKFNLVDWNQSMDCCTWDGVSCHEGRVISLRLTGKSIVGGIEDSSLFNLRYLESLDLSFNHFSTPIPSSLGKLTNLRYLNLSTAGFVGQIPIEIAHLTNLVTLDFSTDSLVFLEIPRPKLENPNLSMLVHNLSKLEELYLDGVNISARGRDWCQALSSSLPNLRVLSLSYCSLSGPIDHSLLKLQSLSVIRLDINNLSTQVPGFIVNFSNLTSLHLSNCVLYGIFPKEIFQVQTLQTIDISNNILLEGSLPELPENSALQKIVLSFSSFSGKLPASVGTLRNLSMLDLSNCKFNGTLPNSMTKLTQLVDLDLSFNELNGPIPSFKASKNLTQIVLSHNRLTGTIPSAHWEGLLKLTFINLRNNFFHGNLPSSLAALPSLEKIQLSNNQFNGQLLQFQDASSSKLASLDLSSNNLEGTIPMSIFHLRELTFLSLSSNKLNGTVQLDMVQKLGSLTSLDLSYNNLSVDSSGNDSTISCFVNISTLKLAACKLRKFPCLNNKSELAILDLSNNQIHGEVPSWIWNNSFLVHLNLSRNYLGGILELPYPFPSLSVLDLHSNQFHGKIPTLGGSFAVYIDFSNNNFTFFIPADIGDHLSNTLFFSISKNDITGFIPESICSAINLQVLDFSNNNISGRVPACLFAMSQTLGVLNLRNNNFDGAIPDAFPPYCSLKTIDLNGNFIEGQVPKSLGNCSSLEILDLGHNKMVDDFPCFLMNISTLRVLVLRSNKFYGHIGCLNINETSTVLQIVDLARNNFSGKLPIQWLTKSQAMMGNETDAQSKLKHLKFEFFRFSPSAYYQDAVVVTSKGLELELVKILTIFTSIDLSSNNLQGPIPEELGELKGLYVLNLSNNALDGEILSSIGNLGHLESLDLSWNHLSGTIPTSLQNLNFLSFLNVSFNQIVGRIPEGSQLQTFSADSYMGNQGLCGFPLKKNCTEKVDSPKESNSKSGSAEIDWNLIWALVGFGFGFGVIVWPLVFCKRWRKRYFKQVDDIGVKLFPRLFQTSFDNSRRPITRR